MMISYIKYGNFIFENVSHVRQVGLCVNVTFPGEIKCEISTRVNSMIQREMALLLQYIRLTFSVKPGSQHHASISEKKNNKKENVVLCGTSKV